MSRWDAETLRSSNVPTVLVIGASPEFLARCRSGSAKAGAVVISSTVQAATTTAAERRPVAIVLTADIHGFDPGAFAALAKDVRATLVTVPDEAIPSPALESAIEKAVTSALRRRPSKSRLPSTKPPTPRG